MDESTPPDIATTTVVSFGSLFAVPILSFRALIDLAQLFPRDKHSTNETPLGAYFGD